MNWVIFLLVGAGCGFVSAGVVGGKRGSELVLAVLSGAVTALLVGLVLVIGMKLIFGILPLVLAVGVAAFVLFLLSRLGARG